MKLDRNTNNLVSYSRAGDVFHYRWAAKRCLRLIQANSNMESVVIEGSQARKKAGEYVIDVSEYYSDSNEEKRIEYYQLKHTTVQKDKPFNLSDLQGAIEGFSDRFQQHKKGKSLKGVSFTIITNRKIDDNFKKNIESIVNNEQVNSRFHQTLRKYTNLGEKDLIYFCSILNLEDSEGDYNVQKEELRKEMARLQPGVIDPAQVANLVSLIQEKILPNSDKKIVKEEVLQRFGVTSERQLFPAPPMFEELEKITIRKQYHELLEYIINANKPLILQAAGGVGKSIFSNYLISALPNNSIGVAYDCFGSGKYRSRSQPRHRHRDALVQIANELAAKGLCERMVANNTIGESDLMHDFLRRIEESISSLKQSNKSAKLLILIDAADNAEMAAKEFGDSCFASELLREEFPEDCHLVLLCRPERTNLLDPTTFVQRISLCEFSEEETFENLKKWFPSVKEGEALEFHRLTYGNPRVQMNSITSGHSTPQELLMSLGPTGTTVDEQIEKQLNVAVQKIKDSLPLYYQIKIINICKGLASLPPNIPIGVLSKISRVSEEDIRSFVSDMGKTIWLLDSSVQFRDEPTETWFRSEFLSSKEDIADYIKSLEPIASDFTYIAEVLPQLYLQAGQYDKLVHIALSDEFLPINNPIDRRSVIVFRLEYAFKAALRSNKYNDAIKIALRAGEEVAGNQRQQSLLRNNLDLLPKLQDNSKIQEIAFKSILKSNWEGSENIYSATLLSDIDDFRGEASGYLRSGLNWLNIYFKESKKREESLEQEGVDTDDIMEIALTVLNIKGIEPCLKFLNSLKPKSAIFSVMKRLVNRLIDASRFEELYELLKNARRNKYHVVAIISELGKVGIFAKSEDIEISLKLLSQKRTRIKKPNNSFHDDITPSIITFLEACFHHGLNTERILQALDYYIPKRPSSSVSIRFNSQERTSFLRTLAIRNEISKQLEIDLDELLPDRYRSEDANRVHSEDIRNFKELIGGLYPFFLLRAQIISGHAERPKEQLEKIPKNPNREYSTGYSRYADFPTEVSDVTTSILVLCKSINSDDINFLYENYLKDNSYFKIEHKIRLLRTGNRSDHLLSILGDLELSAYKQIKGLKTPTQKKSLIITFPWPVQCFVVPKMMPPYISRMP